MMTKMSLEVIALIPSQKLNLFGQDSQVTKNLRSILEVLGIQLKFLRIKKPFYLLLILTQGLIKYFKKPQTLFLWQALNLKSFYLTLLSS